MGQQATPLGCQTIGYGQSESVIMKDTKLSTSGCCFQHLTHGSLEKESVKPSVFDDT